VSGIPKYLASTSLVKEALIQLSSPLSCVMLSQVRSTRKVPEYLSEKDIEFSKIKPQDQFRNFPKCVFFFLILSHPHFEAEVYHNSEFIPGQIYQEVPEYLSEKVIEFSKIKPQDRFRNFPKCDFFFLFLSHPLISIIQG
jgi:hypothetical protein